jgi:hypothetical protein
LAELLKQLHKIAPFRQRGKYTHRLTVDEKTQKQAYAALASMWDQVEQMLAAALDAD